MAACTCLRISLIGLDISLWSLVIRSVAWIEMWCIRKRNGHTALVNAMVKIHLTAYSLCDQGSQCTLLSVMRWRSLM